MKLTKAQEKALRWLGEHNADGCFSKSGVLYAAGETAPFTRSTWNALRDAGAVAFYRLDTRGHGRACLTPAGLKALTDTRNP